MSERPTPPAAQRQERLSYNSIGQVRLYHTVVSVVTTQGPTGRPMRPVDIDHLADKGRTIPNLGLYASA